MPAVSSVAIPIRNPLGADVGWLHLSPTSTGSSGAEPLIDASGDVSSDEAMESVQLLEDGEYHYRLDLKDSFGEIRSDRQELLSRDPQTQLTGRLKPGSYTGLVSMRFWGDGAELGEVRFEVRSRKLGYLTHYRWMLRDISEVASGLAMEQFAIASGRYKPDDRASATTAYERFCFLRSLFMDARFQAAVQEILSHPHHSWEEEPELRPPGRGASRLSGGIVGLVGPGPRVAWPDSSYPVLQSLPRHIRVVTGESTYDTPPNRFVKFVLGQWIGTVSRLQTRIRLLSDKPARDRGLTETNEALRDLDETLSAPLFWEVGDLDKLPTTNQVLQRREGYREVNEAYWLSEAAAQLCWSGGEDVYSAGQRDVATLYEYWCFIQILSVVRRLCSELDLSPLLRESDDEIDLALRAGRETIVTGVAVRLGRRIRLSLSYNRSFSPGSPDPSWTRPMRPDCSIKLESADADRNPEDIAWVHLDAKYRADRLVELFGDEAVDETESRTSEQAAAKRADLLKMHAYRDAIRRTVGSYVLYPGLPAMGGRSEALPQYHEILPGLGAFLLRPGELGEAEGTEPLQTFLSDVLNHFASVLSQDRRHRFWEHWIFKDPRFPMRRGWAPDLDTPAADTPVLVGYVKNGRHLDWIHSQLRYNLRVGDRRGAVGMAGPETGAGLLVLYGQPLEAAEVWTIDGPPEIWVKEQMIETRYPNPRGTYLCLRLGRRVFGPPDSMPDSALVFEVASHQRQGLPARSPVVANWAELLRS